jgi:hypothetical protein
MYSLFIKNTQSGDIYELPWNSLKYIEQLNTGKEATITCSYLNLKTIANTYGLDPIFLLTAGLRELWIEKLGQKMYYGVVSDVDLTKTNNGDLQCSIASVGFVSLFAKRRTAAKRVFTATDAGQIAWTLINESQNDLSGYGNLGITQGTIMTSANRDQTYRFADIKGEIEKMSYYQIKNGFDFDIDNNKQLQVWYPQRGTNRPEIVLDDRTLTQWTWHKPGVLSLTNRVYALGAGANDDIAYQQCDSLVDYKAAFKLLEDVVSDRSQSSLPNLADMGNQALRDNQSPQILLTLSHNDGEPDILNYSIGDSLAMTIPEVNMTNELHRVLKRTVSIDANELAQVDLEVK